MATPEQIALIALIGVGGRVSTVPGDSWPIADVGLMRGSSSFERTPAEDTTCRFSIWTDDENGATSPPRSRSMPMQHVGRALNVDV